MLLYADLVLPLPLDSLFTYEVPFELQGQVKEGVRAVVHFGKKKYYTGIVIRVYESEKRDGVKPILHLLDTEPVVLSSQLKLWDWLSSYYLSTMGDVYKAAVPSALRLESKTYVYLNPEFEAQPLTASETKVYHLLSESKPSTIAELETQTKLINVLSIVKSLSDKGIAMLSERVLDSYSAKTQAAIRFARNFTDQDLHAILDDLKRAPKQQDILLLLIELLTQHKVLFKKDVLKHEKASANGLAELAKKKIIEIYDVEISRFDYGELDLSAINKLNPFQEKAHKEIVSSFDQKDVTLLFGVTSSGKTEIYIKLIEEQLAQGRQVLYLLPEIALTTQIMERLKNVFGNKLAVYHSKFNDNERADIWNNLLNGDCRIVLGARSAVFLPFVDLGLVIVDEEHEGSYKQQDPAPRYNARNAAMVLANIHRAKTLLGTATPAIETYFNALNGRYGLVRLTKRHEDIELPEIEVVNVKELRRTKKMKSVLSPPLIEHMQEALAKNEQVILFQNRRGFSSLLECKTCSWTLYCDHCDVSLTYHKGASQMVCHYCGTTYRVPTVCPECKTPTLEVLGYGTERVEEEVQEIFPEVPISRMDLDTTRGKRSYERLISDFELGKTKILIGTQMVSKGLDFDNVSVVGILNADNLLNYPDFRAYEKAFQLMVQVSGRAGRKNKQGLVVLQTSQPGHPIISYTRSNDYESFYEQQLAERRLFHYPPYFRLVEITLRSKQEQVVDAAAKQLGVLLKSSFENRILGPTKPPIARVQTLYVRKILLKVENATSVKQVREALLHHHKALVANTNFRSVMIHYNVDPV